RDGRRAARAAFQAQRDGVEGAVVAVVDGQEDAAADQRDVPVLGDVELELVARDENASVEEGGLDPRRVALVPGDEGTVDAVRRERDAVDEARGRDRDLRRPGSVLEAADDDPALAPAGDPGGASGGIRDGGQDVPLLTEVHGARV